MDATIIQGGLSLAEQMINRTLAYDPASQYAFEHLEGKVLAIHIHQPELSIYLIMGNPIKLQQHIETEPDTALTGELSAFLNLARSDDKQAALMQSDIHIKGSSQLAMSVAQIMAQLDIDFEAMLAKRTGPVPAHMVGKGLRRLSGWFEQTRAKFKQDSVEYIRDELRLAPHKQEGEQQFAQIHQVKLATERLQARIERLKQTQL
ncbi:SCP2 domain-containing protein [Bermanella sp. R86510]|uniref:ubiquinone biosynthesis accessory factor UbiJ n=1 Tax=unclassified Bermanella TaxID=2627862 RepID=UPI0037C84063